MELPYKVFKEFSDKCPYKHDWQCGLTQYACKDYMCPQAQIIAADIAATSKMPAKDLLKSEPKQETAMEIAFKNAKSKKSL